MAVAYLAQHAADPDRRSQLVAFIREHWEAINEAQWFASLWPEAAPDGPDQDSVPTPETGAIRAWVRHPLFKPMGPPKT